MKISFILVLCLSRFALRSEIVNLRFHVVGLEKNTVAITKPINGKVLSLYPTALDIHLAFGSDAELSFAIEGSTFINVKINNEDGFPIAVNKGDSISFDILRDVKNGQPHYHFHVFGSNSQAHQVYINRFYPPGRNFSFFEEISKSSKTFNEYYHNAILYIDKLIHVWDSLKDNEEVSDNIYHLYVADTKASLYNEAIKKLSKVKTGDSSYKSYVDWLKIKKVMFFRGDADNLLLLRTYTGSFLRQSYLLNMLRDDPSITDTLLKSSEMGFYWYYDKLYREDAWGMHLLAIRRMFPSIEMTDHKEIQVFKRYFPDSKYLKEIEKFSDSILNARRTDIRAYKIDLKEYEDIESIFSGLKGRYFFIDLWATWCIPCLQEFQYSDRLERYLASKEITLVLMSIDQQKDRHKWENFVKKNLIPGYHVLISDKVQTEILKILNSKGQGTSLFIPRYILFDKNNKRFFPDLPRPSTGIVLENAIDKMLKTTNSGR